MIRTTVVAVALCLVLIATLGAGVVTARPDENPRQAGSSSVYFYDVAATDAHGTGRLMIDVDRHTFVFNGKDFEPSAIVTLRAMAAGSTEIRVFATGKATPSGNLHLNGTWRVDAMPTGVSAGYGYTKIDAFRLHNYGLFVAKIACYYSTDGGVTWHESAHGPGIGFLDIGSEELGHLGVPAGALVKIHAVVVGGKDRTGSDVFQYGREPWQSVAREARYTIDDVTWNPKLLFQELYPY